MPRLLARRKAGPALHDRAVVVGGDRDDLAALAAAGIDYNDVSDTLEREGVQKFSDSFQELLEGISAKRGELVRA